MKQASGPLKGLRVVEFAGIGPGPMCGMLLSDMGADVLLVERIQTVDVGLPRPRRFDLAHRGKTSIAVDLKDPDGVALAESLCGRADVMIEGFRPGVMERIGLGPQVLLARNPGLIYGRMTGYGQQGPLSAVAGHDLNYISLSGILHGIGRRGERPVPPLNLIGDYAGGAMSLAFGIVCALRARDRDGGGQVIDASMVEGAALLMAPSFGLYQAGMYSGERGENLLDGGAPFYDTYICSDGQYIAFAAVEQKFRRVFAQAVDWPPNIPLHSNDPSEWPKVRRALEALFRTRTRDEWCALLEPLDSCVTPVLSLAEVSSHQHNAHRQSFVTLGGVLQPAPAPRLESTPGRAGIPPESGQGGQATALRWGLPADRLLALHRRGIVRFEPEFHGDREAGFSQPPHWP